MEKSCLLYQSYFGINKDISVACCGSSLSWPQLKLLLRLNPNEVIIAFDRQYQAIGDAEYKQWVRHLKNIYAAYNRFVPITFIFDKKGKLDYSSNEYKGQILGETVYKSQSYFAPLKLV